MDRLAFILSPFTRQRFAAAADRAGPKYMLAQTICSAVVAVFLLGVVAYTEIKSRDLDNFIAESRLTQGRVVSFDRIESARKQRSKDHWMVLTFKFEDALGHPQTKSEELNLATLPDLRAGSEIGVYLSPHSPEHAISEIAVKAREHRIGLALFVLLPIAGLFMLYVARYVQWKYS